MSGIEKLREALGASLAQHPEVREDTSGNGEGAAVTFIVEPASGPHRSLTIKVASLDGDEVFVMRWSSYRGSDDSDGGAYGDLAFALSAIRHWIFEGRPWREVPEFNGEWVSRERGLTKPR